MSVESLITQHIDIWTSAVQTKSAAGRGTSSKLDLYGIKKLRELILGLGLSGKLTQPNRLLPADFDVRIQRARAEYERLENRKTKEYSYQSPVLYENPLPDGWQWLRVGQLCDLQTGATPSRQNPEYFGGSINWLVSGDINRYLIDECEQTITESGLSNSNCKVLKPGTVMIALNGQGKTRATVAMLKIAAACNQSLVGITPFSEKILSPMFLLYALKYRYFEIRDITGQKQRRGLNMGLVAQLSVPLAPLEDQEEIVQKVDELMKLCDQLEQQTEASIAAHQVLVETLLATLTNSKNAEELMENWQRISAHFDTLFTTIDAIDQLKQTILQLAVMGKLVPQNPADESPTLLLDRIQKHQLSRIKNKEIQKPKRIVPSDELDLDIPRNWQSILLNNLVFVTKLAGFEYTKYIKLKDAGQVAVIRAQNVRPFSPSLENIKYIDSETSLSLPRSALDRPALLVTFIGAGIGDVCVFDKNERWHLAPNVAKVEPFADLNLSYLCLYLNSSIGRKELFKSMKSTAQPSLSMTSIRQVWVALPPIEEQSRIVCKVRELMDLCQQLQTSIKDGQATQLHLTDAIVEQVL